MFFLFFAGFFHYFYFKKKKTTRAYSNRDFLLYLESDRLSLDITIPFLNSFFSPNDELIILKSPIGLYFILFFVFSNLCY